MVSAYGCCGVAAVSNGAEVALLLLVAVARIEVPGVVLGRRFIEAWVNYCVQNEGRRMIIF